MIGELEQRAELVTEDRGDRRQRGAEPESRAPPAAGSARPGQTDASSDGFDASRRVAAHHDEDGRVGDAARRARLDLGEHLGGEPRPRELASAAFPCPPVELADAARRVGVAHDDEHPRLRVLGARREGRRLEHALDHLVGDGLVGERAARALRANDGEEVGLVHAERSPSRRNVFTYMIRSSGVFAQCVPRRRAGFADAVGDERCHRAERGLGLVGVHLVEVEEARIAAGHVLVRA